MKHWPLPDSYFDEIPRNGSPGSFWEDRNDRFHCGVDLYAPAGAEILAIDGGKILDIGVFTNPNENTYWNETSYVILKSSEGIMYKYAELEKVEVKLGQIVIPGHPIGKVGTAINSENVTSKDPFYIRELIYKNQLSMLHLEIYKSPIMEVRPYSGGNFLGTYRPSSLLDPNIYLVGVTKNKRNPSGFRI